MSQSPTAKLIPAVMSFTSIAVGVNSVPGKKLSAVQYTKNANVKFPTIHATRRCGLRGTFSGPSFLPSVDSFIKCDCTRGAPGQASSSGGVLKDHARGAQPSSQSRTRTLLVVTRVAANELPDDVVLVDIRDGLDALAAPIDTLAGGRRTVHTPLADLEAGVAPDLEPDAPLVVVCGTGSKSELAGAYLLAAGFNNVMLLDGGIRAWRRAREEA
jgi:rhodanese-related sulfurtransferase